MTTPPPPTNHLAVLDLWRGVAILCVCLYHARSDAFHTIGEEWHNGWLVVTYPTSIAYWIASPLRFGWSGVSLFFVLSGFVIHLTQLRTTKPSWRGYAVRRFFRIVPPYWIALVAFTALAALAKLPTSYLAEQFVWHFFFLHNFRESTFFGISPAFWSLATEVQFYLLYPLIWLLRTRRGMGQTLIIVALISIATRVVAHLVVGVSYEVPQANSTTGFKSEVWHTWWESTLALWFDWVLGAYMAERFVRGQPIFARPIVVASCAAVGVVIASQHLLTVVWAFPLASIGWAALLERSLTRGTGANRGWIVRRLMQLGIISYSLYLWHQPLLMLAGRDLNTRGPLAGLPLVRFVMLLGVLLVIALGSAVLYRLVEKQFQTLGRRLTKRSA